MRLYTLLAILLLSTCILIVVVDAKARHSARTVQDEAKSVDADVDDIDDDDSTDLADLSSEEENYDDAESDVAAWEGAAHADAQLVCTKSANDPCECKMSNGNTLDCRRSPKKTDRNTAKILFTTKIKVKDEDFHAKIVYMSGNEIRELRAKDLLPGQEATVESLDFYNNNIADVRPDAFDKFEKLKKLRLSRNFISITEQNAYVGRRPLLHAHRLRVCARLQRLAFNETWQDAQQALSRLQYGNILRARPQSPKISPLLMFCRFKGFVLTRLRI